MKSECKYSFEEVKAKAEAFCAYQDRSIFEVELKLGALGLNAEDIPLIISHLISSKFLDEKRFVSSYVSGKFRIKKWGKQKIKASLNQKKISSFLIHDALMEIDQQEYVDVLLDLAQKKWAEKANISSKWDRRSKVILFLQSKGFELDLIQDVVSNILKEQ